MVAGVADRAVGRVLRTFGLDGAVVTAIPAGFVNEHWQVEHGEARYVLRRYSTGRLPGGIPFEHEVLAHLGAAGWPVAPPHTTPDGTTLVKVGGRYHALFPFLGGARLDDPARHGAVLARLHGATSMLSITARPGWPRLAEYARRPFGDLVAAWAAQDPDGAALAMREHGLVARDLARFAGVLPALVVHGDFHTGNLLFDDGQLTGVLDFDFARIDWRVTDVAIALGFLGDEDERAAFLAAYEAEAPLSDEERLLIPALIRARALERVTFSLRRWRLGDRTGADQVRGSLERLATGEPAATTA